jgi:hypothetical protein
MKHPGQKAESGVSAWFPGTAFLYRWHGNPGSRLSRFRHLTHNRLPTTAIAPAHEGSIRETKSTARVCGRSTVMVSDAGTLRPSIVTGRTSRTPTANSDRELRRRCVRAVSRRGRANLGGSQISRRERPLPYWPTIRRRRVFPAASAGAS